MNKKEVSASLAGNVLLGGELSVHRLGFGAMRLTGEGIWGPPRDRKAALAVLRRAVELDIQFIDTADSYGPHTSEELIAEALFPYPDGLVIATKGGWNRPGPNQWTHDATPAHLREAIEGSLKRLRLERIDIYQLWQSYETKERFASSDCLTSRKSILSGRAELCRSSRRRTDIALPTASGTTWWTTVSRMELLLSRGSRLVQARSQGKC
jgi:aryl-alcohol dehydrogenase-like predicted oxidoreductase